LTWGVVLVAFGVVFLLDRIGYMPWPLQWFVWWPVFVIALGMVRLVRPRRARDIGSAVLLTILGLWFLFATNNWYGLTWHNSWPVAVVAVGASMVARALAARVLPDVYWKKEEEHHA